ncbi:MAG: Xaa-Pro peptidase family protein [Anaerolineae bacterium]|nr:Xaa-Pro peptidase family protein [Anaerolineae bacterium]
MRITQGLADMYAERRRRLMAQMGEGIALIHSGGVSPDSALWDKNLAYLTGLDDQSVYLLLAPQGVRVERVETRTGPELMRGHLVHEILFVAPRSAQQAFMEGEAATFDEIQRATGVDRVYALDRLEDTLARALMGAGVLWLNTPGTPSLSAPLTPDLAFIRQLRERFYWVELRNIARSIHEMRFVKDAYEIASLREAFAIQTEVFEKIMRTLKPGDNESLGQAIFEYELRIRGDNVTASMGNDRYAASIIVGAGKNSAIPHYMDNNQAIQDGDLVLIDAGVSVNGYASDITRTFPANGRFSPRQRALYAAVLEAQQAAIDTMKPGSTLLAAHQAVYDVFKRYDLAQYSYGNCGHTVGLNIHDATGRTLDDREQPFVPGVVLVIEPFLTLPEEGMGIRIEDGVLITDAGCEVLAGPPRDIDAVEALCRRA